MNSYISGNIDRDGTESTFSWTSQNEIETSFFHYNLSTEGDFELFVRNYEAFIGGIYYKKEFTRTKYSRTDNNSSVIDNVFTWDGTNFQEFT